MILEKLYIDCFGLLKLYILISYKQVENIHEYMLMISFNTSMPALFYKDLFLQSYEQFETAIISKKAEAIILITYDKSLLNVHVSGYFRFDL